MKADTRLIVYSWMCRLLSVREENVWEKLHSLSHTSLLMLMETIWKIQLEIHLC